jgi:hypothetical protein
LHKLLLLFSSRLTKFRAKFLELHQRRQKTQELCVAAGSIAIEELQQMDEFFVNLPNTLYTPKQAARFMRFIHENKALGIVINSNIEKLIPLPHQRSKEKYRSPKDIYHGTSLKRSSGSSSSSPAKRLKKK